MKATGHLPLFLYLHPLTPQLGLAIETTEMGQIETGHTSNTKSPFGFGHSIRTLTSGADRNLCMDLNLVPRRLSCKLFFQVLIHSDRPTTTDPQQPSQSDRPTEINP